MRDLLKITQEVTSESIGEGITDMGMDGPKFIEGILGVLGPSAYHAAARYLADNPDESEPCEHCRHGRRWKANLSSFKCDVCHRR